MKEYQEPLFRPLDQSKRIVSIDVLRGIALFGILLMNIVGFGLPFPSYGDPTIAGGSTGLNLFAWTTNSLFFEGTMRAIFSLLFGAGFILLTTRIEAKGGGAVTADVYYRRTIWLLIFGLVHAYLLLWTGEILYSYGLMGMFLYPFRNVTSYKLFLAGLVLILIGTGRDIIDHYNLQETQRKAMIAKADVEAGEKPDKDYQKALESWEGHVSKSKPEPEVVQDRIDAMHEDYFSIVATLAPVNASFQSSFAYRYDVFDILSMMLIGIAFYRWGIITAKKTFRFYWTMVLAGYSVGITVNYFETMHIINNQFDMMAFSEAGMTYNVGRLFTAMGHVGLVMIFCKSGFMGWLSLRLAAVGKLALTNYIMHTVICNLIFMGFGFSMFGRLERYQLYFVVFSIWIFQLIISPIYLKYYRFGPLEWLWRWLIYKKKPVLADAEAERPPQLAGVN
jgi:uncharacterized protein